MRFLPRLATKANTIGPLLNSNRMRGLVLHGLNDLRVEELIVAPPGFGQVLVDMRASGICQTQLLEVRGKKGEDRFLPHLLGHEGAGVVRAVGEGVTKVAPGDTVLLSWIKGSGADVRGGQYQMGDTVCHAGPLVTFAEQVVVSENRVTRIVSGLPFEEAALLSCAVATGAGMVFHTARLLPGQTIAIFGAGGVGCAAMQAATLLRASRIFCVDVSEEKLAIARTHGATDPVLASEDSVAKIREMTGGIGVDYAIDASGHPAAMENAHRVVKTGGGMAIIAGNPAHGATISIDPFALIQGKRLIGTWGGETVPDRDFPRLADLAARRLFNLSALISHRVTLEEVPSALAAMEKGLVTRAVLVFPSV